MKEGESKRQKYVTQNKRVSEMIVVEELLQFHWVDTLWCLLYFYIDTDIMDPFGL